MPRKRKLEIIAAFRKPDFCLPSTHLPKLDVEHGTFEGNFTFLKAPARPAQPK